VVVTGWLPTTLLVVTAAALAEVVAAFTGWLNAAEAAENDGDSPGEPLLVGPERPEENTPAEYGADEFGCTDSAWCSPACLPAPVAARVESGSCCVLTVPACCPLPAVGVPCWPSTTPLRP
jgi:hypothetical protein